MGRSADLKLAAEWRARVARQSSSGLTIAAYCRQERVSQPSFYFWKRRLSGETPARVAPSRAKKRRHPRKSQGAWAPFRTASAAQRPQVSPAAHEAFVQIPLPVARGSAWIEFSLPDGTVIRLPEQNLAALERILDTLAGRRRTEPRREVTHA
jgi:hypothetical protein